VRRRIIFLVALPAVAAIVRVASQQLEKRGHPQAGQRARRAADAIRPQRKKAGA
jgi:hypothetical protein